MLEWFNRLCHRRHRHHHRHKHHPRVVLVVNGFAIELNPHWRTHIMFPVNVGHTVSSTILYLDQNGNPMLTPPTPDSAPTWTNAPNPAGIDTLTVSADGLTANLATTAEGSDTLSLSVTVGGKTFTATEGISITAAPQTLTSVQISSTVQ